MPGGKTLESVADARGEDSRVCGYQGGKTLESVVTRGERL